MNGLVAVFTAALLSVPALAQSPAVVAELPSAPVATGLSLSATGRGCTSRNPEGPTDAGASRTDGTQEQPAHPA